MKKANILKLLLGIVIVVLGVIMFKMCIYITQNNFQTYKKNMLHYFPTLTQSMDENTLKMSREYNWYSYKWNKVYYQGQLLSGAYARSFIILEGYGIDTKSNIFYIWETSISWLDVDSLQFIDELPLYIQDIYGYYFVSQQSWYIIYENTKIDIHPLQKLSNTTGELHSIKNLSQYFARDDKYLYYMWYKVSNVNPNSIVPIEISWNIASEYYISEDNVFMWLYKIPWVDVSSFTVDVDNQTIAYDAYHTYKNGKILK